MIMFTFATFCAKTLKKKSMHAYTKNHHPADFFALNIDYIAYMSFLHYKHSQNAHIRIKS